MFTALMILCVINNDKYEPEKSTYGFSILFLCESPCHRDRERTALASVLQCSLFSMGCRLARIHCVPSVIYSCQSQTNLQTWNTRGAYSITPYSPCACYVSFDQSAHASSMACQTKNNLFEALTNVLLLTFSWINVHSSVHRTVSNPRRRDKHKVAAFRCSCFKCYKVGVNSSDSKGEYHGVWWQRRIEGVKQFLYC